MAFYGLPNYIGLYGGLILPPHFLITLYHNQLCPTSNLPHDYSSPKECCITTHISHAWMIVALALILLLWR